MEITGLQRSLDKKKLQETYTDLRELAYKFLRGNKGALRIPFLSFQYLRRPGCTAKLLCFQIAGGFESHRLHHLKKPKNLPSKTANCCQHCCQLSIFLLHSNKNLSGLPRKNGYGPLHSHRAQQHRRRQISVRQCAVLEESSPDSNRRSDLLSPSDQWRQAHSD